MKSQRHSARGEPRRIGNVVIIASMLVSLLFLSFVKARFCTSSYDSAKTVGDLKFDGDTKQIIKLNEQESTDQSAAEDDEDEDPKTNTNTFESDKPLCSLSTKRSETCDASGDIRVEGTTQTVFVPSLKQEHKTKPYARRHDPVALENVKEWTFKPFNGDRTPPSCTKNHSVPALIFSNKGFTGNLFHDYTDVLIPLFITSYQFRGEVQFLISGIKSWWVDKFILIFKQLTNYEILDIDNDENVHCFPRVIAGPTFHKELGVDPSKTPNGFSVLEFKRMLRKAFGLDRSEVFSKTRKPRLLIISRKNSRRFMNEKAMAQTAAGLGFDVRIAEPDMNTDMSSFARLVNSADVMIGVHGAGLTNMVFLPVGAVLIQVVPFGGLEWLTRVTFKDPAEDMGIHYMDYNVQLEESTLSEQYPKNHPVLQDPYALHKQGWDVIKSTYLDKQNIRPNPERFKKHLNEALKLLRSGHRHKQMS